MCTDDYGVHEDRDPSGGAGRRERDLIAVAREQAAQARARAAAAQGPRDAGLLRHGWPRVTMSRPRSGGRSATRGGRAPHLAEWRRWRRRNHPEHPESQKPATESQLRHELERVRRENARLRLKLEHAEKLAALQKSENVYKRCNQENLIEQAKNGVPALKAPVDSLLSNWAYMVMTSLALNLKVWTALLLPVEGRWRAKHEHERSELLRMEMKRFINSIIRVPCQIVRTGRRVIYRLLRWNRYQAAFLRLADAMRHPLRC